MRSTVSRVVAPFILTATLGAAPAADLNRISPDDAADGWLLLFDGESLFGWDRRGEAEWSVGDGILTALPGRSGFLSTTTEFADYDLELEFQVDAAANSGVFLRCPTGGDITAESAYEVNIAAIHPDWPTGSINGIARTTAALPDPNRWNTYRIRAEGQRLAVWLNGEQAVDATDSRHVRGTIALQRRSPEGTIRFRNIRLRPLGLRSIFNGKDLAGWRVIPGRQSVYSVTAEGWLNVKNGNGDIQTLEQFADFVLQLQIISNGRHLNSGIFFRAIPDEFWQGYESQIRNQWEGDDRSKPVDFGTGGIYRRQPARRVVSNDHEWFTKTIIAAGRHLSVWVNGVQVSDWTDSRPDNENPREGFRASPGVISIQGHDPTTDLSFRDLRIAELPPARTP